jgi:hypothetical protein
MAAHAADRALRQWAQEFIHRNAASDVPAVRRPFAFTIQRILEIGRLA